MRCVARNGFALSINQRLFYSTVKVYLEFAFKVISGADDTFYQRVSFAEFNSLFEVMRTKRLTVREQVNRFQPVRFTLSVVAVEDVEACSPVYCTIRITELVCLNRTQKHR